jgi:hypothetical protein
VLLGLESRSSATCPSPREPDDACDSDAFEAAGGRPLTHSGRVAARSAARTGRLAPVALERVWKVLTERGR